MMLSCWELSGSATGEDVSRSPVVCWLGDLISVCGLGVKLLDDQASQTHGDMQGASDSLGSLPDLVRPFICLFMCDEPD